MYNNCTLKPTAPSLISVQVLFGHPPPQQVEARRNAPVSIFARGDAKLGDVQRLKNTRWKRGNLHKKRWTCWLWFLRVCYWVKGGWNCATAQNPCHIRCALGKCLFAWLVFSQPFLVLSNGTYDNPRLLRLPHPFFFKGILTGSVIDDRSPLDRFFLTMFDLRNIPDSYSQWNTVLLIV